MQQFVDKPALPPLHPSAPFIFDCLHSVIRYGCTCASPSTNASDPHCTAPPHPTTLKLQGLLLPISPPLWTILYKLSVTAALWTRAAVCEFHMVFHTVYINCILGSIMSINHCTDNDIAEALMYEHRLVAQALAASHPEGTFSILSLSPHS